MSVWPLISGADEQSIDAVFQDSHHKTNLGILSILRNIPQKKKHVPEKYSSRLDKEENTLIL